ncbi:unnamed protein product [Protopolystoma xenopodis]|uniref:Uncharacterized protein n=1 Tax=Protopolystoma xenopodis TaxID=117903 RepID=A0A3S5APG2_9PLAT|nr:unnamed protein product [Protopolystoma xenopodis]
MSLRWKMHSIYKRTGHGNKIRLKVVQSTRRGGDLAELEKSPPTNFPLNRHTHRIVELFFLFVDCCHDNKQVMPINVIARRVKAKFLLNNYLRLLELRVCNRDGSFGFSANPRKAVECICKSKMGHTESAKQ